MKKRKQSNNDKSHPPSTLCTVYFVFLCIFGQYTKYESKAGEDVCKHNCTKLRKKILKCNL